MALGASRQAGKTPPPKQNSVRRQAAYRTKATTKRSLSLPTFKLPGTWLWLLLLFCILLGVSSWLRQPQTLPLRQVDISGIDASGQTQPLKHIRTQEVQAALRGVAQGNILRLNMAEIQQTLLQLPWVRSAKIERHLPATLFVQLQEQQAVAYWQTLDDKAPQQMLLNPAGELFTLGSQAFPDLPLPHLHGIPGSEAQMLAQYQALQQALTVTGLRIETLQLDALQQWRVWLSFPQPLPWFSVTLGKAPLMTRWQRFIQLYQNTLVTQAGEILALDLRYDSGVAVHFR